jgi:hypothetical protein
VPSGDEISDLVAFYNQFGDILRGAAHRIGAAGVVVRNGAAGLAADHESDQ